MSPRPVLLALCMALAPLASVPALGQAGAPAGQQPRQQPNPNPYQGLWTGWSGVSRESLEAETQPAREAPAETSIPAMSPLTSRSRADAEALGARVGEAVRAGDCAEGERIARAAGDFPLVEAVRDYCARRGTGLRR
jgi:hypothetical protein